MFEENDVDKIINWISECAKGTKSARIEELDYLKTLTFIHGETLLHFAVVESLYSEVEFLLNNGWTCEVSNEIGSNPLVDAVKLENHQMVKLLLEKGSDANFSDKEGNTPLHYAFFDDNKEIIKTLIAFGSDPSRKNIYGETPDEF